MEEFIWIEYLFLKRSRRVKQNSMAWPIGSETEKIYRRLKKSRTSFSIINSTKNNECLGKGGQEPGVMVPTFFYFSMGKTLLLGGHVGGHQSGTVNYFFRRCFRKKT